MGIRVIGPGDRAAWEELWTAYLAFYETVPPRALYDATWERLNDPAAPIWGAFATDQSGTPVGLVHWLFHATSWSADDICYLQDLFVAAEARGGGHGRALIEHVADAARAAGAYRLYWHTHETNFTAQRLYDAVAEKPGFIQYRKAL